MKKNCLSIIVPAFNEAQTILLVLEKIKAVQLNWGIRKEIIIVDDGSVDTTTRIIRQFLDENIEGDIKLIEHKKNIGKGAAIQTGISHSNGEFLIVQDADLEYDPKEYNLLLQPIIEGYADVVYGSRFIGGRPHRILFFWHSIGNKFLTFLSNAFNDLNLTDMETCYKLFKAKIIKEINLKEKRFGFEPEVTAKVSRIPGIRIYEVGISYYGRTYKEGKKIGWRDGLRAIYCIVRYGLWRFN